LKDLLVERSKLRKHAPNVYRITLTPNRFGQVRKQSAKRWTAEVRDTDNGNIVRHVGVWPSLQDAVEELENINPMDL
jgi:hypothetical protein